MSSCSSGSRARIRLEVVGRRCAGERIESDGGGHGDRFEKRGLHRRVGEECDEDLVELGGSPAGVRRQPCVGVEVGEIESRLRFRFASLLIELAYRATEVASEIERRRFAVEKGLDALGCECGAGYVHCGFDTARGDRESALFVELDDDPSGGSGCLESEVLRHRNSGGDASEILDVSRVDCLGTSGSANQRAERGHDERGCEDAARDDRIRAPSPRPGRPHAFAMADRS